MSALDTLARVARRQAEEIERQLAAAEARIRLIEERIGAHDRAVAREYEVARATPEAALALGAFAPYARAQRKLLIAERDAMAGDAETLRGALRGAFIEVKKIDFLIAQEAERAVREMDRRDQIAMDDIAANMMRARTGQ